MNLNKATCQYHEKQAKILLRKAGLENELVAAQDCWYKKEARGRLQLLIRRFLNRLSLSRKILLKILKLPSKNWSRRKTNRDTLTIRSLNDVAINQDEIINKLNKEKKHLNENAAKAGEDLRLLRTRLTTCPRSRTSLSRPLMNWNLLWTKRREEGPMLRGEKAEEG